MQLENVTLLESVIRMPLMQLPVRSVAIAIGGATVLISPGSRLQPAQLQSLGKVTDIVAPSFLHAGGVPQAVKIYPQARLWGPPGLEQHKPQVAWTHALTEESWEYADQLPAIPLEGMSSVHEVLFVHKASRSLIVSDFCFNLIGAHGIGAWLILHLFGTYQRFAVSKFFMKYIKDKAAFERSLERVLTYNFDKIIVGHGEIVASDAPTRLRAALKERGLLGGQL